MKRVVSPWNGVDVWKEGVLMSFFWRKVVREMPIEAVPRVSFCPEVDVHSRAPSRGKMCSCLAT